MRNSKYWNNLKDDELVKIHMTFKCKPINGSYYYTERKLITYDKVAKETFVKELPDIATLVEPKPY
tara:strand:+ start:772 stop:969 length:198 start_codon:yes stop_codon:yes gene_type:complete